ncbi:MAG: PilZ domain-containing protein, partial [Treponema sp.]|nr:PilZ domain-containing protein [Treponema sp.]
MNFNLLQASISDFGSTFRSSGSDPKTVIYFVIGLVVVIAIVIIYGVIKKNVPSMSSGGSSSDSAGGINPFANLAIHGQLRGMGLNRDQIKMLDFVFKQDNVTNPQHSLASPALLDRHFRKAYRAIEHSSRSTDETQQRLSLLFSARNVLEANSGGGITSTHNIPENSDAVLGFNKESYPIKILSTKGENIIAENPQTALGAKVQIPRGSKVMLSFFTKSSKGFSFESRVLGTQETTERMTLHLVHSDKVIKLAKRRFRRRQVAVSVYFYFVNLEDDGRGRGKRMVVDNRRMSGNIMDISIGGC